MSAVVSNQSNLVSNQSNRAPEEEDPEYEEEEETYEDEEKDGGSGTTALLAGGGGFVALAAIATIVICICYSGACGKNDEKAPAGAAPAQAAVASSAATEGEPAPPKGTEQGTPGTGDDEKKGEETPAEVQETRLQKLRRSMPTMAAPKRSVQVSANNTKFSSVGGLGVIVMIGAAIAYFAGFGRTAIAGAPQVLSGVSPTAITGLVGGIMAISGMAGCCYNRNAVKESEEPGNELPGTAELGS